MFGMYTTYNRINKACGALLNITRDSEPGLLIATIFVTGRSNSWASWQAST